LTILWAVIPTGNLIIRREFIAWLGAAVVCCPLPLRARGRTYRIALLSTAADTLAAFREVVLPELVKTALSKGPISPSLVILVSLPNCRS
jgi:hypothetical protein